MSCPIRMYKLDIINQYINELLHINNFNKYKNELIRSFYNCDCICENCDEDICNKINKELIQNEILNVNELCNGCDENYCQDCQESMYPCEECGDIGMFEEDYIYFAGPVLYYCDGCNQEVCDMCIDSNCIKCSCKYCCECINEDGLCLECENTKLIIL